MQIQDAKFIQTLAKKVLINVNVAIAHNEKVGMTDQMLRQLVMNNPYTDTSDLLEEKVAQSDEYLRSLCKNN